MNQDKGLFYSPSPPPQTGGEAALRQWAEREYMRISYAFQEGRSQFLRLDVLREAPSRPSEGMVGFFAANAVGTAAGVYAYVSGAWTKL